MAVIVLIVGCRSTPTSTSDPFLRPSTVPPPGTGAAVPPAGTDPYYAPAAPGAAQPMAPATTIVQPASPAGSYIPPSGSLPPSGSFPANSSVPPSSSFPSGSAYPPSNPTQPPNPYVPLGGFNSGSGTPPSAPPPASYYRQGANGSPNPRFAGNAAPAANPSTPGAAQGAGAAIPVAYNQPVGNGTRVVTQPIPTTPISAVTPTTDAGSSGSIDIMDLPQATPAASSIGAGS
ncbi:MAG TPA: hypothetical protein VHZ24_00700 [Pirellulales bacterium]|nr:hypothetical protein [Pirellulales bacterium]